MRILSIKQVLIDETDSAVVIGFIQDNGARGRIVRDVPDPTPGNWRTWAALQIETWLENNNIGLPDETLFPDVTVPLQAKDDFENLPGWATWTGQEAADWIDANVTDLASAKTALAAMARAIMYLRDIVIER